MQCHSLSVTSRQYGTAQYSAVSQSICPIKTVRYRTVKCSVTVYLSYQDSTVPHSRVQCHSLSVPSTQYGTAQYSAVSQSVTSRQYPTAQYSEVSQSICPINTVRYRTVQCSVTVYLSHQHSTVPHSTVQCHSLSVPSRQ